MKAYIQTDKQGNHYNVNAFIANQGFVALGWETEKFMTEEEIKEFNPEDVLVGGIANVRNRLKKLGRPVLSGSRKKIEIPLCIPY
jgi:hypothetical protein